MAELNIGPYNGEIHFEGDFLDKKTFVFSPGLTSSGRTKKYLFNLIEKIRKSGKDYNIVTYDYPSNKGRVITDFERDSSALSTVIESTKAQGIPAEDIGLIGACYGSYLSIKYLERDSSLGFSMHIEPFTSTQDFSSIWLASVSLLKSFRIHLPINHLDKFHFLDLHALYNFIGSNSPTNLSVPSVALLTNFHSFFNKRNQRDSLEKIGVRTLSIPHIKTKQELEEKLSELILPHLVNF